MRTNSTKVTVPLPPNPIVVTVTKKKKILDVMTYNVDLYNRVYLFAKITYLLFSNLFEGVPWLIWCYLVPKKKKRQMYHVAPDGLQFSMAIWSYFVFINFVSHETSNRTNCTTAVNRTNNRKSKGTRWFFCHYLYRLWIYFLNAVVLCPFTMLFLTKDSNSC